MNIFSATNLPLKEDKSRIVCFSFFQRAELYVSSVIVECLFIRMPPTFFFLLEGGGGEEEEEEGSKEKETLGLMDV